MANVSSPCIKICTLDLQSKVCIGCGRTLQEIGNWLRFTDAERLKVTAQIPERLAQLKKLQVA